MGSPFQILLKQGWLQVSLKSFCSTILGATPSYIAMLFGTSQVSTQFSPQIKAMILFWMELSAFTAAAIQFFMALIFVIDLRLFHESHFALLTNSNMAGFGVLQSPIVACLYNPYIYSLVSSVSGCLLIDNSYAVISKSCFSASSGTSTSQVALVAADCFSSCLPKSLLNEFLIKFIQIDIQ